MKIQFRFDIIILWFESTMSPGTSSYPKGNPNYPRRQVENEIEKHAKAYKKSDLDRALNRPVSGLFFCLFNYRPRVASKNSTQKNPRKIKHSSSFLLFERQKKERKKSKKKKKEEGRNEERKTLPLKIVVENHE